MDEYVRVMNGKPVNPVFFKLHELIARQDMFQRPMEFGGTRNVPANSVNFYLRLNGF